jgi:hypothetical protein
LYIRNVLSSSTWLIVSKESSIRQYLAAESSDAFLFVILEETFILLFSYEGFPFAISIPLSIFELSFEVLDLLIKIASFALFEVIHKASFK